VRDAGSQGTLCQAQAFLTASASHAVGARTPAIASTSVRNMDMRSVQFCISLTAQLRGQVSDKQLSHAGGRAGQPPAPGQQQRRSRQLHVPNGNNPEYSSSQYFTCSQLSSMLCVCHRLGINSSMLMQHVLACLCIAAEYWGAQGTRSVLNCIVWERWQVECILSAWQLAGWSHPAQHSQSIVTVVLQVAKKD
jgi:hypothetical protein